MGLQGKEDDCYDEEPSRGAHTPTHARRKGTHVVLAGREGGTALM
jgi:hypothetical protein